MDRVRQVRRLVTVLCDGDPVWTLQLLQAASPLVEELELWNVKAEHWLLLHSMPRLYRLEVRGRPQIT